MLNIPDDAREMSVGERRFYEEIAACQTCLDATRYALEKAKLDVAEAMLLADLGIQIGGVYEN